MAEDKLYEEANESLSDSLLNTASEAAAVFGAAVSFYRAGGARALAKKLNQYEKEIIGVRRQWGSLDYAHINKNTLKHAYKETRRIIRDAKPDEKINLVEHNGTGLQQFIQGYQLLNGKKSAWIDAQKERRITNALQAEAEKRLSKTLDVTKAEHDRMLNFVRDISKNITDEKHLKSAALEGRIRQHLGKNSRHEAMARDMAQEALKANKEFEAWLEGRKKQGGFPEGPEQKIAKEALKAKNLKRATGALGDKNKWNTILGDRPMTYGEMLEHADMFTGKLKISYMDNGVAKDEDIIVALRKYSDSIKDEKEKQAFLNVYADPSLRIRNGEISYYGDIKKRKDGVIKAFADTMPGKIFKARSLDMSSSTPSILHFRTGTVNPAIAAIERKTLGSADTGVRIQNDYYYVSGQTYRYNIQTDEIAEVAELRGFTPVSSRFGTETNLVRDIYGLNGYREQQSGFSHMMGLNSSTQQNTAEYIKELLKFEKDPDYVPTILRDIQSGKISSDLIDRYERAVKLNTAIQTNTRGLSQAILANIEQGVSGAFIDQESREIAKFLQESDNPANDILEKITNFATSIDGSKNKVFYNENLQKLWKKMHTDKQAVSNSVELLKDVTQAWENGDSTGLDINEQIARELSKELVLRLGQTNKQLFGDEFSALKNIFESSNMTVQETVEAKRFAYAANLDYRTEFLMNGAKRQNGLWDYGNDRIEKDVQFFETVMGGRYATEGGIDAAKTFDSLINDSHNLDFLHVKDRDKAVDIPGQYMQDDYVLIKSMPSALDVIGSVNDSIMSNSKEPALTMLGDIWKQVKAGRDTPEDVSRLTMLPYFFLRRLGDSDLPSWLQFSHEELASTKNLAIGLGKRLGFLAVAGTELEWADDTVGAITGTRASAGFVNGIDYMDIGAREILDFTHIGGLIDDQMQVNPLLQYWFGRDGYYDADEERDYHANGVEAVRRGRWWSFGSVNEFRGSQIEYYQPNLTRRLNSDYYNKSLYEGYWDKWGHSLLPTPAAPLSPLVYAMDPYYLEEEHKEDRPYAVSGSMFAKETPWGIVLNPTIGELIKPVVAMNTDRLDDDGNDVKAIIYGINKHIRDTAAGDHAYAMVFDREQITAGEYTTFANPNIGEYNVRIGRTAGEEMQDKKAEALGGIEVQRRVNLYEGTGGGSGGAGIIGVLGSETGGGGESASPLDMLGQTNRRIYQAAAANANRGAVITTDRIAYSKLDDILSREDTQDLINAGQGGDLVNETARSLRLIGGIYGYGANRAFGFGESDGKQIADAGDIDSFSRSFWDEAIGGIGGGASEIGRRFIPEFRRNIRLNPLLNNMPDWIPENLRFGDPYAALPKGEARLPGKGYEALNELHPDEYGLYGSFDRYKILADVAPNSTEFKVWKKIANATVKDQALQDEMRKIQERVNERQKSHDFYNYNILGNSIDYHDAVISEVNNDGTFRIKGSSDLYTIAGIDFAQKHTNPNDYEQKAENQKMGKAVMEEYLHPGMTVTLGVDSNPYHQFNSDAVHSINAAVYVDGESISQTMLEEHPEMVTRKKDGINAADVYAMTGSFQRFLGGIGEGLAHLDLPMIHDKWMRVRTPLESYKAEQVYGTPYQTWSDIMGTYVEPAWERAISNPIMKPVTIAASLALESLKEREGIGKTSKMLLSGASWFADRGAFMGGMIAKVIKPSNGEFFQKGKALGMLATAAGSLYTATQTGVGSSAVAFGAAGWAIGDLLDESKAEFSVLKETDLMKKFWRSDKSFASRFKAGMIGAAAGIAARGMFGDSVEGQDRDSWTPERVKKKWELEEYFDRLTYIKYMGLYHKAAREAESQEGINMEKIFDDYEEWSEKRREIMAESDVNTTDWWILAKRRASQEISKLLNKQDENNHRFEYSNGFSINDLPGVRNGVFHSEEISEEERLYTLNALVTMGIRYNKQGTNRTQDDRDMTQLTEFERLYGVKIPSYYEVHHIVEFSQNGPDDPSNMIALNPDDHLYITEQQHKLAAGDFEAAQVGARTAMRLGEYGRAALLYKKAAESTMYGLRADARWTDVVKALPKYERDYFTEFMKEQDPEKQKEILGTVSPFLRRALQQVWGQDYEEMESNEEYFENHTLPGFMWEGWNPDSDLNKIKAKTIKNEGMLFSDFGIFESTYRDQEVINAPNLSPKGSNDPISVQASLKATLSGLGLTGVDVSVEPKYTKGISTVINLTKVTTQKVGETISDIFSV